MKMVISGHFFGVILNKIEFLIIMLVCFMLIIF